MLDLSVAVDAGLGSPFSPEDSTVIHKVSNSDDEDAIVQARRSINMDNATQLSRGPFLARHLQPSGATRPVFTYNDAQATYSARISTATSREDGALQYRSPYAVARHEQRTPAPETGRALPRHPDMLPQNTVQPPRQTSCALLSYNEATGGSQHTPQSALRLSTNLAGAQVQNNRMSAVAGGIMLSSGVTDKENQGSLNIEGGYPTGLSEGAGARGHVQMLATTGKHAATSPHKGSTRRSKNYSVFGPGYIDLPYQTTKVINMPARGELLSGQRLPEPTPDNLPYGDTEDYQSSMLIFWLDELELSYREGIELFKRRFPAETANPDTIRRRHLGSLQRLARKYGLKPTSEIVKPGSKVLRRGLTAGARYSSIGGEPFEPTTATHVTANLLGETTAAAAEQHTSATPSLWIQSQTQANRGSKGHIRSKRVTQPLTTRGLLLACIVVWKDTEGASFEQIQKRLADEFSWELGTATIRKVYYEERPRVYDVRRNTGDGAQVDAETNSLDTIGLGEDATGKGARFGFAGSQFNREHCL